MILAELLDLEHQGWQSLCDSTGADFYGQIMLEEAVMLLAHGQALDRSQVMESLNSAPAWSDYEITDAHLVELTDSSGVLTYRGAAWRGERTPVFQALMSSVYVKRDGTWRLASYQQTVIPPQTDPSPEPDGSRGTG